MATAKKTTAAKTATGNGKSVTPKMPGGAREVRSPNVKLPPGVPMKSLSGGTRPQGFLVVPTQDDPKPTTFVGVLRAMGTKNDPRRPDKPMIWGVFEAVGDQESEALDRESGELLSVTDGLLVGVSRKGALHGMSEEKIGYLFAFEYTGVQIPLDKGRNPMWEVFATVSEEPYVRNV
jgi:hypothetical protein